MYEFDNFSINTSNKTIEKWWNFSLHPKIGFLIKGYVNFFLFFFYTSLWINFARQVKTTLKMEKGTNIFKSTSAHYIHLETV